MMNVILIVVIINILLTGYLAYQLSNANTAIQGAITAINPTLTKFGISTIPTA